MFGFGLGLRESQGGCAGSFKHVFVTSLPPGAELHQKGLHVGTPLRPRCSRCSLASDAWPRARGRRGARALLCCPRNARSASVQRCTVTWRGCHVAAC